jgi:hypothetical protein
LVDIEAILDHQVSDTTLRARRYEWIDAGVFEDLMSEALAAFDRIIGLDLDEVALDGSLHKAPYGGEGTGPNPIDRGKSGWKWSVASDRHGIPIGWAIDGANRHDVRMLEPTLEAIKATGLFADIGTLHLDRGYDSGAVRDRLVAAGIDDFNFQRRGTKVPGAKKQPVRLGLRWIVEAASSPGATDGTRAAERLSAQVLRRRTSKERHSPTRLGKRFSPAEGGRLFTVVTGQGVRLGGRRRGGALRGW